MKRIILASLAIIAAPALAQGSADDLAQDRTPDPAPRELCSDRPGLNTPACTVDPGRLQVEIGVVDWTLDRTADQREDTIQAGDVLLRYGVGATTEVRLGWTAYGHVRGRDVATGEVDRASGVGDVTLGIKQNLRHPDEEELGLALAVLPYVTLPVGKQGVGAGDWSAGLVVPASFKLNDTVSLALSPEVDAAANENGSGRHLAYGAAMGVQLHLSDSMDLTPELMIMRDDDPSHHATMSRAALSFDVQPSKMMQIDVQMIAGLNRDTPDIELGFGITRKF